MIRRARRSDEATLGRMWYDLLRAQGELDARFAPSDDALERWRNDFRSWLERLSRRIYVAEVDGEVRGFVTAEQWAPPPVFDDRPGVFIDEIYVDPDYRRAGIGTRLVDAVKDWAEELGVHQVRAGIVARNEAGAAFWRSIGADAVSQTFAIALEREEKKEEKAVRRRSLGFRL